MSTYSSLLLLLKQIALGFVTVIMYRVTVPTGNPEPNITWTKDGNVLSNRQYGQWSLKMEDTVVYDSGNYTCVVCNFNGCINFTFELDIIGMFLCVSYVGDELNINAGPAVISLL